MVQGIARFSLIVRRRCLSALEKSESNKVLRTFLRSTTSLAYLVEVALARLFWLSINELSRRSQSS